MRQVARTAALAAVVLLSATVLAFWFWRVSPLLPERGATTCFAAEYTPSRSVDLTSPRRDQRSVGEIESMRLDIFLSPDERPYRGSSGGYDWRYSVSLKARLTDGVRLSAAATCEWR